MDKDLLKSVHQEFASTLEDYDAEKVQEYMDENKMEDPYAAYEELTGKKPKLSAYERMQEKMLQEFPEDDGKYFESELLDSLDKSRKT